MLILTPSSHIYRGVPWPLQPRDWTPSSWNRPWHWMRNWHVEGRAEDEPTYGRLTRKCGRSAPNLTGTLLGGPSFHICGAWLVLRRFGSSGGPVDPCECIWFVEKVLPRIDDLSPCLWAAFLLMWGYLVGHLILIHGCAFCLDLWSVFSYSWCVFSLLIHLHTNIDQHSWKWSVLNPYH